MVEDIILEEPLIVTRLLNKNIVSFQIRIINKVVNVSNVFHLGAIYPWPN